MNTLFSTILLLSLPLGPNWPIEDGRIIEITSPRMGWVDTKYQPPCVLMPGTTVTEVEAIRFNTERIVENENGCRTIMPR